MKGKVGSICHYFCRGLKRKDICEIFSKHEPSMGRRSITNKRSSCHTITIITVGEEGEEKLALRLLVSLFNFKKQPTLQHEHATAVDVSSYIYEKHLVST